MSRSNFDAFFGGSSEALAKEAFQRMDVQLDLSMRTAGILEGWSLTDYQSEYKDILRTLSTGLSEVWDAMGLPFVPFMTGYIQTWLYAVITAVGLTPWPVTESRVPQGGPEGPFLYLLVPLPLAFKLAPAYPGYTPYPLRSPLINFADDNLLTTATRTATPRTQGYQRPRNRRPPFSSSPQHTGTPTNSWCTAAKRSG